jgi:SNF2 family DNA or RNA helicase
VYGRHRYYRGRSKRMIKFQVLVTTYEVLMQDYDELSQVAV